MRPARTGRLVAAAATAGIIAALALSPTAHAAAPDSPGLDQLAAAKTALDRAAPPPESVTSWYVDEATDRVVVEVLPEAEPVAAEFAEANGVSDDLVTVVTTADAPRLLQPWPLREGDPYYVNNSRCTVGFLIRTTADQNGFITAGHCGSVGVRTRGFNQEPQGNFWLSQFPGSDWAVVLVSDDWIPTPITTGSQEAPIGGSVCKIGSTTGYTCGTITAKNVTVNYPQGTVTGLTRTTICAEPGDSGGPVFSGNYQGQGIVSGGSGNCAVGGVTFFQPLLPILSSGNLNLITAP